MTTSLQWALMLVLFTADCRPEPKPSPQPSPQSPPQAGAPILSVTGRERVAWDQDLLPDTNIDIYEFAAYVNGERRTLSPVQCEGDSTGSFVCSAGLPPLRPGRNTLVFVAVLDGTESERSEPLELQLAGSAAQSTAGARTVAGGLRTETIATGLDMPSDLAMLPDGRLLIAERRGRIRVVAGGTLLTESAAVLADVAETAGLGLFAIVAHPDFAQNRFVYLAYTAKQRDSGAVYRVIRARELNNTLAEFAIIHESVPATAPAWISARFGPDRKLYIGIADCAGCGSAFAGVVLRLDDDGSTPRDRAPATPVYMRGLTRPVALSWRGDQLWVGDWQPQSTSVVVAAAGREYPFGATAAGAIVTRSENGAPMVLLTRPQGPGAHWYEIGSDASSIERAVTLADDQTVVHAMLYAADGAIYMCASDSPNGAARLIRLTGWS